jgi:hypothetical protein
MHTLRLICFLLGTTLLAPYAFSQSDARINIRGKIEDSRTNEPISGVEVRFLTATFFSDEEGRFDLITLAPSGGKMAITLTKAGYQEKEIDIFLGQQSSVTLGNIILSPKEGGDVVNAEDVMPTITLSTNEQEAEGEQSISGLLTASSDVFVSSAAYNFSAARFRMRGYSPANTEIYLNGAPINDLESGVPNWSLWSGLNDVVRNRTNSYGLGVNPAAYGGIGGSSAFDTRASRQRRQFRVSYAVANRTYRNRVMATYSTGLMRNGWAVSISGSRRWADEGYVPGTFYDAYSYFLSVDRKLNSQHLFNLTAFGAPVKRGRSGASNQEMYDLAGSNFYNPNWGYQDGKKRNARVADTHQPMVILRHDWMPSPAQRLTTTASYQTGRNGLTSLDWYNGRDPRPDYYQRLPSYVSEDQKAAVADVLRNDENARQMDWGYLYDANRNSMATILNADGQAGNNVTGKRAQYVLEEQRFDRQRLTFNANWEQNINTRTRLTAGANYQWQKTHNYKVLNDLLGADFYLDIDKFAQFDSIANPSFYQNNLDIPNRLVRQGDVFGYNYNDVSRKIAGWGQIEYTGSHIDFFGAFNVSQNSFWRQGLVKNGKYPNNSEGASSKNQFTDFGGKMGMTYKLNGRNYLVLNAAYQRQSPLERNAYISPRTRDQITPGLSQEQIYSVEGGYLLRAPYVKIRITGYFTQFVNQLNIRSFYLDNAIASATGARGGFVNYVMTGVATRNMGVEIGGEFALGAAWKLKSAASIGQYIYTSRPDVYIFLDNVGQVLRQDQAYLKNFKLPNVPQTAATVGLNYNSPKFWFANLNVNYFGRTWIDINPERRTSAALAYTENPQFKEQIVDPGSELWNKIVQQQQLPSSVTVNFFAGKSWKINKGTFVYLNLGVNNLLDNKKFISGGSEQFRFDYQDKNVDKYPNRYFYSFGRNYFASIALRM